jgi:hypothetical protein
MAIAPDFNPHDFDVAVSLPKPSKQRSHAPFPTAKLRIAVKQRKFYATCSEVGLPGHRQLAPWAQEAERIGVPAPRYMAGVQDEAKHATSTMSPLKSCDVEKRRRHLVPWAQEAERIGVPPPHHGGGPA